ncbi:tyrosine-type recombinase/integrase [Acinetobacter chinensis]|uniref:tyrosine-type recombinase/integrase n=1 Tax=Acinetobacter chinensis TaxID=2004650 RepID=UPI0029341D31|nr:integrase arm-type DNA-binding domain-containing protein [Acinetobacter chinensis]WOE40654.1 tyrosine-type recombinase/integrase [Acinetobacter chinensis]
MLTDTKLRSIKPKETMYRETDSLGLSIEVKPTGKKFWRYRFRYLGKQLMMTLGTYPTMGLAEARKRRDEAKLILENGENPIDQRRKEKEEKKQDSENIITFKNVAEEYFAVNFADKSDSYSTKFLTAMKKDIYKIIGDKDIRTVSSADVLAVMKNTISRVRRQKNYGTGEVTAIENRKFIGAVMRYAIVTLRAEYDPTFAVAGAVQRPSVEHARPLTKDETKILRTKLDSYGGSTTVKNAGLTLLYTMLRTIELRRMLWEFVDFEDRLITFPIASRSTGQQRTTKKNRIHIVPMSDQVFNILQEQYKISGQQEYVFPAVYKKGMLSATTLNRMLDFIELGEVTAHDFRATASTLLNEKGYDEDWIEKQLAHSDDNKTRASYNHARYLDDRRNMLQDWADIVDGWKE